MLLGVSGQQCCVRLHGPKSLTSFKLYATSANKCQHCCSSSQTDATCCAQKCCVLFGRPTMLRLFAWASTFTRLHTHACEKLTRVRPRLVFVSVNKILVQVTTEIRSNVCKFKSHSYSYSPHFLGLHFLNPHFLRSCSHILRPHIHRPHPSFTPPPP